MQNRLVDIRAGEWGRLAPLSAAYALVLASVYMLKPARNALFLDHLGIARLPFVLILVAVIGGGSAIAYARFTRKIRIHRLLMGTFAVLAVNLLIFRWLFALGAGWIYYLFYIWVNLFGLVAVSLLWLLANSIFNAREARRLFGLIGTGGIAGAILGGTFTGWAVDRLGTENLLLVCAGLLFLCLLLVWIIPKAEATPQEKDRNAPGSVRAVLSSPLLKQMALMAGIVAAIAAIADVQFNQIADHAFPTKDEKTAFFGTFFAWLNGFAFVFQLLMTPFVLKRFGVTGALLFLPVSMAIGASCVLLLPGLWGGVAVKVGDVGFRHAIHKSAIEVLFLPIPNALKKNAKVFLDTTIDNIATGLGAVLVLLLADRWGVSYPHLSFLSLALIVAWGGCIYRLRKSYIDAFRQALERREIRADEFHVQLSDRSVIQSLTRALQSQNDRQVVYALEMLTTVGDRNLTSAIAPLLDHAAAAVRIRALRVLQQRRAPELMPRVEQMLQDDAPNVCLEAMHFLQLHAQAQNSASLRDFLRHRDGRVRSAAIGYIARYGKPEEKRLIDADVIAAIMQEEGQNGAFDRAQLARAIARLDNPAWNGFVDVLKTDRSVEVVRETIRSLGRRGELTQASWLMDQLGARAFRADARQALAAMGERVLPNLLSVLDDPTAAPRIRRAIPRVMAEIHTQASVDALIVRLDRVSADMSYLLIKGLSKLRAKAPHLNFHSQRIDCALMLEAQSYFDLLQIRTLMRASASDRAHGLLLRALTESIYLTLERMFRLLGLQYPPRDMYHAYLGMTSMKKIPRANALEFLDNVLARPQKTYVLAFLDTETEEAALSHGRNLFGSELNARADALGYLLDGGDVWLKTCALNCIAPDDASHLIERVHKSLRDVHPLVSDTARFVARRFEVA